MDAVRKLDVLKRHQHAFDVGEELGVPALLDAEGARVSPYAIVIIFMIR